MLLALGCGEPVTTPTADTGPPPPAVDEDGDGVGEKDDCDDGDADVWFDEPFEGDVNRTEVMSTFCDGYCKRNIQGSLVVREGEVTSGLECVKRVTGDLVIAGDARDVSGLESIKFVGGSLRVEYLDRLARLVGIQVTTVGGDVVIENNKSLERVGMFRHLEQIDGDLIIDHNPSLEVLAGRALEIVGGSVSLQENLKLVDPTGLSEIAEVQGGGITLRANDSLGPVAGFTKLTLVNGPVVLDDHVAPQAFQRLLTVPELRLTGGDGPRLIEGFGNLRTVEGDLVVAHGQNTAVTITGFPVLTVVGGDLVVEDVSVIDPHILDGLASIQQVGGDVRMHSEGIVDTLFLDQIRAVGGSVQITGCKRLVALTGFGRLREVAGDVEITRNERLETIPAFSGLETVRGEVRIKSNPLLWDLGGFASLRSIGGDLELNSNWHSLHALTGLELLETIGGDLTIQYNYKLEDVSALHGLRHVGGDVCFYANQRLSQGDAYRLILEIDAIDGNIDYELQAGLCDI